MTPEEEVEIKLIDTTTGGEEEISPEECAFRVFADFYPHEAARMHWKRFCLYANKRNPELTPRVIKRLLWETEVEFPLASPKERS